MHPLMVTCVQCGKKGWDHLAQPAALSHGLTAEWQPDECAVHGLPDVHPAKVPAGKLVRELVHQLRVPAGALVLVPGSRRLGQGTPLGIPDAQAVP